MSELTICAGCGKEKPHYAKGLCKKCYMRMYTRKTVICAGCGESKPHAGKGLCHACYQRMWTPKTVICKECGETKPHYARGMCHACYQRERMHITKRSNPMSENKSCTLYLGVHIAEQVLSKVFKDVEVMPPNNPGYDFLCGKGYKIDVKSACLRKDGGWMFTIKRNEVPDYFLCLAFDNRADLTPLHVWLLPNRLVNHLSGLSIHPNTLDKWSEYELDVDRVNIQCDLLRSKMEIK